MYNLYIITLQINWRITPKGFEEATNIFDIKRSFKLDFKHSDNAHLKENEFDYFTDSVKVEIVSEAENKDESFESYKESQDEEVKSIQSVRLIRNLRKEGIEGRSSKTNLKIKRKS
jgi:hypothetical protein